MTNFTTVIGAVSNLIVLWKLKANLVNRCHCEKLCKLKVTFKASVHCQHSLDRDISCRCYSLTAFKITY